MENWDTLSAKLIIDRWLNLCFPNRKSFIEFEDKHHHICVYTPISIVLIDSGLWNFTKTRWQLLFVIVMPQMTRPPSAGVKCGHTGPGSLCSSSPPPPPPARLTRPSGRKSSEKLVRKYLLKVEWGCLLSVYLCWKCKGQSFNHHKAKLLTPWKC